MPQGLHPALPAEGCRAHGSGDGTRPPPSVPDSVGRGTWARACPRPSPLLLPPSRPAPAGVQPQVVLVLTPNKDFIYPQSVGDYGQVAAVTLQCALTPGWRSPHGARGRGQQSRGGRHNGGLGGETRWGWASSPGAPAVTHAALRHGGSLVPGGPWPRASSRPGHNIPAGWANTGCKTHTAGTGGGQCQTPMGASSSPLPMPARQAGQHPAPSPIWGTHRRGVSSSALALHACKGDPVPALAPVQNRRQHYPLTCVTPSRHPRVWMPGAGAAQAHPQGGSSGSAKLRAGGCSVAAHRPSPQPPLASLLGGSRSWPQGPRVSPGFAPSRAPAALTPEVAPHWLRAFGKGCRCLWAV